SKREKIERAIICFLVNYPEFVDVFHKSAKAEDFEYMGDFLNSVYESIEEGEGISASNLISKFSQDSLSGGDSDFIAELTASVIKNDAPADKEEILKKKKEAESLADAFVLAVDMATREELRKKLLVNPQSAEIGKEYMQIVNRMDRKRQGGHFEKERRKIQR
ncbi:MAG: hypothetical protein ABII20_03450, partial [Candidatus Omnitrophota bacterium]